MSIIHHRMVLLLFILRRTKQITNKLSGYIFSGCVLKIDAVDKTNFAPVGFCERPVSTKTGREYAKCKSIEDDPCIIKWLLMSKLLFEGSNNSSNFLMDKLWKARNQMD